MLGDSYQDKHVWIIGASSGIGKALAIELASRGAQVTASARRAEQLKELESARAGIQGLTLDVSDHGALENATEAFKQSNNLPDSIVYASAFYEPRSIDQISAEELSTTLQTNLWAALELCRLIAPLFYARKSGQIALVGSVAGYCGLPNGQPYSATKAAIINFAESFYHEAKAESVDVKLISPGFVETPMTDKNAFDMKDIISPDEAALAIADGLLSDQFEIHFPKRFTRKLKVLRLLPYKLYFKLMNRL